MTPSELTNDAPSRPEGSAKHFVHSLMHFIRIVRYRKGVVITSVVVALLLGGLYYTTATRLYQSRAGILVTQTGHDVLSTRLTPEGAREGLMPTYERILRGSNVLENAVTRLRPQYRVDLVGVPREKWAEAIKNNLTVITVRNSNVIEVIYQSKSPHAAAAVVQAIVDSYLDYMREINSNAGGAVLDVLIEQKDKTDAQLKVVQRDARQLKERVLDLGMTKEGGADHPALKAAMALKEELIEITKTRAKTQALLGAVEAAIRHGKDLKQFVLAVDEQVGQQFMLHALGMSPQDATVHARLQEELVKDRAELESLRHVLGNNNPEIRKLVSRIREREGYLANYQIAVNERLDSLQQLGPMLVDFLSQRLNDAVQYESHLTLDYNQAVRQASQLVGELEYLDDLERTEIRLDDQITKLVERITEVGFLAQQGNIRTAVTDDPKVVESKVWPRLFLVGPFSLIVGLAFGVAAVSVLDVLDDRFRSPDELRLQLAVPLLAMIKKLNGPAGAGLAESGLDAVQMHVDPDAVECEAFRTLRTAIAFSRPETGRIVISSTDPGDGKTTVLSNLAMAYARAGKRTLMIDADMRRPGLTRLLELRGEDGLTQVLQGTESVAEVARRCTRNCGVEGLDVLPSGPRQINPAELLAGPRLAELLAWAESNYDQILIDAPPAGAAADASMIAVNTDGLVLVIRPDKNRRQHVVRAIEGFRGIGIEPLGIVVNGLIAEGDKGYYAYAEGYNYGYGEEGRSDWSEPDQVTRHEDSDDAAHTVSIKPRPTQVETPVATEAPAPIVPRRAA
jgi:capsular exopolysaccharide synthesis family protein